MLKKNMLRLDKRREKTLSKKEKFSKGFPGRDINTGDAYKDKMLKGKAQRKLCEILVLQTVKQSQRNPQEVGQDKFFPRDQHESAEQTATSFVKMEELS